MDDLFIDILSQSKLNKTLIAVFTDETDTDRFSAGFVIEQIENGVFLRSIDPNGFDDGIIFFKLESIYKLEINNRYLKNLRRLYKARDLKQEDTFDINRNEENYLIEDVIEKCKIEKTLILIKLVYDVDVCGFIVELGNDSLCIDIVTDEGKHDGLTYVKIEDIDRMYWGGVNQKRIELLL